MRSVSKTRVLQSLLDGGTLSESALAARSGYTLRGIAKHLVNLHQGGLITRMRDPSGSGEFLYAIKRTREAVLRIYDSRDFAELREEIRQAPWVVDLFTRGYTDLPDELVPILRAMVRQSASFFGVVRENETMERLRETYRLYRLVDRLTGNSDPYVRDCCLLYQVYAESVTRDIGRSGLSGEFIQPLDRIEQSLMRAFDAKVTRVQQAMLVYAVEQLLDAHDGGPFSNETVERLRDLCARFQRLSADAMQRGGDYPAIRRELRDVTNALQAILESERSSGPPPDPLQRSAGMDRRGR